MNSTNKYEISKDTTIYTYKNLNVIIIRKEKSSITAGYLDNREYNETIKLLSFLTGIEIS